MIFIIGTKMGPRGVRNGFPEASGGLLDARSRAGGPKGESEIGKKVSWSAPGAHLARLGAVLASPPPPRRGPGRLRELIFSSSLGVQAQKAQK